MFGLRVRVLRSAFAFLAFIFYFLFLTRSWFHVGHKPANGSRALCTGPTSTLNVTHWFEMALSVGPVHCSRDPQISLFINFFY